MNATHYPDPDWYTAEYVAAMTDLYADELRAPGTDDEPWTVPEPDPPADRRSWAQTLALAVLVVALVVVAIVWRR